MSRKVRPHILMVLDHSFPPDLRVENEARSLTEAGYAVTVFSIGPSDRPDVEMHDGYRIVRSRLPAGIRNKLRGLAGTLPLLDLFLWIEIRRLNRRRRIDALHAHDLYLFGACLRAGRGLGIPVVGDMHENWVEALKSYDWSTRPPGSLVVNLDRWARLERRWSERVDSLIVVIEEMKERLIEDGLRREDIVVVPNTVHLATLREWLDSDGENAGLSESATGESSPVLLYVGGIDRHRGIEVLVDAMPAVLARHPTARLVIVGDGATRHEVEQRARSSTASAAIRFEGWKPQESIGAYIRQADVGLIPHHRTRHTDNTIPHKLFHYMAAGLPVIASDCRPLERIIGEAGCGRTFASGDPQSFAHAANELLSDASMRARMGRRGIQAVEQKYNWTATAGPLIRLYNRLLPLES